MQQLEIQVEECTSTSARLIIGPLERGYGQTIGNALRRVLLSSIKGAAISAVRIEGVQHEFTTVRGVKEDVIELLLNLKHVPVRSHSAGPRAIKLEVQGPKKVTAGDFQKDADLEFIDPDAYICTLAEGHTLLLEAYIEQGIGYITADRPRSGHLPVDALLIDAVYSPVLRVKYDVQNERAGQKMDYEKIVMNVTTNGIVAPDIAVAEAAKLLREYFGIVLSQIRALNAGSEKFVDDPDDQERADKAGIRANSENPLWNKSVKELELSIRSENCLFRGGIHTIGDLVSRKKDDLLKIRNLGKISLREIEEKMAKNGISFSDEKAGARSANRDD